MECHHDGCVKVAEDGRSECFRHRVMGIGFKFQGGAVRGKAGFHTTRQDWLREHVGAESEKELLKRKDVARAD